MVNWSNVRVLREIINKSLLETGYLHGQKASCMYVDNYTHE